MVRQRTPLAIALTLPLVLGGCSGGDGDDTWAGSAAGGTSMSIGKWSGDPAGVKVECSGPEGNVTATLSAPEGWKAVTTQPSGGGKAKVTITAPGGKSKTYGTDIDGAVRWGVTPVILGADISKVIYDTYTGETSETGWQFEAGRVSCQQE